MKHCLGEWILSLDADEMILPEYYPEIRRAVRTTPVAGYTLQRHDYLPGGEWGFSAVTRLFTKRFRFQKRTFETVEFDMIRKGTIPTRLRAAIEHGGSPFTERAREAKRQFYLLRLESEIASAKRFEEIDTHFGFLAALLASDGDYDAAVEAADQQTVFLRQAGVNPVSAVNAKARIFLLASKFDRCREVLAESFALSPDCADSHNLLGLTHLYEGEFDMARLCFQAASSHCRHRSDFLANLYVLHARMSEDSELRRTAELIARQNPFLNTAQYDALAGLQGGSGYFWSNTARDFAQIWMERKSQL